MGDLSRGRDTKRCEKPATQPLTIGRSEDNDCVIGNNSLPFVSGHHGELRCTKGWLLGDKLWYKDMSKYGTFYLPPGVTDTRKAIPIHNQKVEIQSGSTLLVLHPKHEGPKEPFGFALRVAVA